MLEGLSVDDVHRSHPKFTLLRHHLSLIRQGTVWEPLPLGLTIDTGSYEKSISIYFPALALLICSVRPNGELPIDIQKRILRYRALYGSNRIGGQFAKWGGLFSAFQCFFSSLNHRASFWYAVFSGGMVSVLVRVKRYKVRARVSKGSKPRTYFIPHPAD